MSYPFKTHIEIIIKPISSLYDLLDNAQMNNYLKNLYNDYSKYIIKTNDNYRIINDTDKIDGEDDNYRNKILMDIYKLKFDNYIKDRGDYEFNYVIVPYYSDYFKMSYPDIFEDKAKLDKIISYEYEKDNIIDYIQDTIENSIRKIESNNSKLQYIKVIYHVPLYDNNEIEYRFQKKKANLKSIYYKDIFNIKNLQRIKDLPMTSKLVILDNIQQPIETVFSNIKKRDKDKIIPYIQLIQFFETLYKYSRNKQLRADIENKGNFHKAIILYSVDFLDKDITNLNNEYYYELPSIMILPSYITHTKETAEYLKNESKYIENKYKVGNNYRCIGKINKVGNNKYKFTVVLKEILFEDIYKLDDTINLYVFIDVRMFGLIYSYTIDDNTNKHLLIKNKRGNIKIFNENDVKTLKYNNIDKTASDNNELYISKSYRMDSTSFKKYLKKEVTSIELLNHLKSPTELKKYEIYAEQNNPKLKYSAPKKLQNMLISNKEDFKSLLNILFYENSLFHLKPRNNSVVSNTQYKVKLDNKISIYEIKDPTKKIYDKALEVLFDNEPLQKKYKDVIYNKKPNYIIYVNLLLQKSNFKKTKYDCKEIKYKLLKHTKRLFSGGSIKLKQNKKNKYRSCRSKQCLRRYSHRKV